MGFGRPNKISFVQHSLKNQRTERMNHTIDEDEFNLCLTPDQLGSSYFSHKKIVHIQFCQLMTIRFHHFRCMNAFDFAIHFNYQIFFDPYMHVRYEDEINDDLMKLIYIFIYTL